MALKQALVTEPMDAACGSVATVLKQNITNRYQAKGMDDEQSPNFLLKSEKWLADYFGKRYGLGVCSGGMAICLGLKAMTQVYWGSGNPNEGAKGAVAGPVRVYTNSFTFSAVPSAIVNAGFEPILVETTETLVMDLDDLERKLQRQAGEDATAKQILCLSYMRGRVPDMDRVLRVCEEHGVALFEDNAHGYGADWKGRKLGSFGAVSIVSTQSNKVVNSGEGGYLFTDNDEIQAYCMFASGCYEDYFKKHECMSPPQAAIEKFRFTVPNFSCRMTNLQGAIIYEQLAVMDRRCEQHNRNYYQLRDMVAKGMGEIRGAPKDAVEFIPQLPDVGPVFDSLQIRMRFAGGGEGQRDESGMPLPDPQVEAFVDHMGRAGFKLQKFLDLHNARYYRSWGYRASAAIHERTDAVLRNVLDMRLGCDDSQETVEKQAAAIVAAYAAVTTTP
eukprot:CAMPEP_0179333412 /NCGR_PEP_ID=MMETSP0797-20121207/65298_1 /TAXON_ID=47934 /ORGANISM="Dinophysis acuminata, Strain DAEP01" /LENGTH=444 /DNA_ID=CAMNT_0021046435 /DNA_START=15 /DNA_END=1349 /DNA_ORIENTATION=+